MLRGWKKQIAVMCWCLPALLLSACGSQTTPTARPGEIKIGKPYTVDGITYYPKHDPDYDKVGEASWYGPGFHGKLTANGEVYDQNALTAAHPTLPLPSMVRVTNLKTGKSAIIRVNDRGPFKRNRIIDLSRASADAIGMRNLAKVRVEYLPEETEAYLALRKSGAGVDADITQIASHIENQRVKTRQIVERNNSNTYVGQTVNDAAPVLSVSSDELPQGTQLPDSPQDPNKDSPQRAPYMAQAPDSRSHMRGVQTPNEKIIQSPNYDANAERLLRNEIGQPINSAEAEKEPSGYQPNKYSSKYGRAPPIDVSPAEASPSAGKGLNEDVFIQVGAFANELNAQSLYQRLSHIAAVTIAKIGVGGQTLWRVKMGPFINLDAANDALQKIQKTGIPDARIIK